MVNKRVTYSVIGILFVVAGFICSVFASVEVIGFKTTGSATITTTSFWWRGNGLTIGSVGSLMALIAGLIIPFCILGKSDLLEPGNNIKRCAVLTVFIVAGAICVLSFGDKANIDVALLKSEGYENIQVKSLGNIFSGILFIIGAITEFIDCFVSEY